MCGRFVRKTDIVALGELFGAQRIETDMGPSFNIAPSQPVAVIMEEGRRRLVPMQWGLIPHWADDPAIANRLINARSETAMSKPAFRSSFRSRRCLILADGFYEWETVKKKKQPVFIYREDRAPFGMAGLYDRWRDPASGEQRITCTILTTEAPPALQSLHHRMPALIEPQSYDIWLDPSFADHGVLHKLLTPFDPAGMRWHRTTPRVNKPDFNDPDCIRPLGE
jgi:putative SOS response-associated peptidase YedK